MSSDNGKWKIPDRDHRPSARSRKNYAVRLQPETVEKLREISKRTGRPINEIVEMAIGNIE